MRSPSLQDPELAGHPQTRSDAGVQYADLRLVALSPLRHRDFLLEMSQLAKRLSLRLCAKQHEHGDIRRARPAAALSRVEMGAVAAYSGFGKSREG